MRKRGFLVNYHSMHSKTVLALACLVWLSVLAVITHFVADYCYGEEFDIITKTAVGNTQVIYKIDKPNVTQYQTDYKEIWFLPTDTVTIKAGGCVQTGGSGKTWKRYVEPSGSGSDKYYSALIWIPGINTSLQRITTYLDQPLTFSTGIDQKQLYLRLGYEDDDYSDNGYWGHDDGTEDQCAVVDHGCGRFYTKQMG